MSAVADYASVSASRPTAGVAAVATATPPISFSQEEVLESLNVRDPRLRSLFLNGGIGRRHLSVPRVLAGVAPLPESQGELLRRHKECGLDIASRALLSCLQQMNADIDDVRHLCCVTTTGLLTPGFSALLCHRLNLRRDCSRLDVVGMGCNAGLNALSAVAAWAESRPGQLAIMICIEVCSAAYVVDGTIQNAVVNSLFADGAGAVAVVAASQPQRAAPTLLKFASCAIPEGLNAMRFDWDERHGKFSFHLEREIPYLIGAHAEQAIGYLLEGTSLRRSHIAHWIVHSGGKKVIDSLLVNLGLTHHDLRHTISVLRDFGNVSSGSFLFSLQRLLADGTVQPGDFGILMTMGPGATIETSLCQW